ncbi:methyltransferase [Sphingomonas sp. HF-S3]|uniref:Methyltransferase n=1 Tax=Sphingomonas rustica TaxID=3103142 RepID=A0ABV0B571_9SPHN
MNQIAQSASLNKPGASCALTFLRGFVANPAAVGSPLATSSNTVRRMLQPVEWDRVRTLVEFGPGVGTFSREVLRRLPRSATLIAIDTEVGFIDHLRATIDDPRLVAVHGSACDARQIIDGLGNDGADHILSGIPFSTLDEATGDEIVACAAQMLRPGGLFMAYQVKLALEPLLHRHFDEVERARQWLNMPPFHLWWARTAT